MADQEYTVADRAQITAYSLGIHPATFAGRDTDALAAMAWVRGYRRLTPYDQRQIGYKIAEFWVDANAPFVRECMTAIAMMTANPDWVPGSLGNEELEKEIQFWRAVRDGLNRSGFKSAGDYLPSQSRSLLSAGKEIGQTWAETKGAWAAASKLTGRPLPAGMSAVATAGPAVFFIGAQTITSSSLSDLEAEVKRARPTGKYVAASGGTIWCRRHCPLTATRAALVFVFFCYDIAWVLPLPFAWQLSPLPEAAWLQGALASLFIIGFMPVLNAVDAKHVIAHIREIGLGAGNARSLRLLSGRAAWFLMRHAPRRYLILQPYLLPPLHLAWFRSHPTTEFAACLLALFGPMLLARAAGRPSPGLL